MGNLQWHAGHLFQGNTCSRQSFPLSRARKVNKLPALEPLIRKSFTHRRVQSMTSLHQIHVEHRLQTCYVSSGAAKEAYL